MTALALPTISQRFGPSNGPDRPAALFANLGSKRRRPDPDWDGLVARTLTPISSTVLPGRKSFAKPTATGRSPCSYPEMVNRRHWFVFWR
jgi:hypothetical protein